jgi:hypothetical protein
MTIQTGMGLKKFKAAICPRCDAKIFPAKFLSTHVLIHAAKDERYQKTLASLKKDMAHLFERKSAAA